MNNIIYTCVSVIIAMNVTPVERDRFVFSPECVHMYNETSGSAERYKESSGEREDE